MADFADRSLGIGYAGGSSLLLACLIATLGAWYWSQGSISVVTVNTPKVKVFYWVAITFSQTLEPIREVLESHESDVIHCLALDSRWSARCGSPNTAKLRTAVAFVTRAI